LFLPLSKISFKAVCLNLHSPFKIHKKNQFIQKISCINCIYTPQVAISLLPLLYIINGINHIENSKNQNNQSQFGIYIINNQYLTTLHLGWAKKTKKPIKLKKLNREKKLIKPIKILKKPTSSVWFQFYKFETEKTKPKLKKKKTGKIMDRCISRSNFRTKYMRIK